MKARFDRQEYLAFEEVFEAGQLDDVTKELCEFSDDIEDMAYELAYTRYALAKVEARHNALREAVAWERECNYLWEFGPVLSNIANDELSWSIKRVRAEVDDLLCKKQSREISNA